MRIILTILTLVSILSIMAASPAVKLYVVDSFEASNWLNNWDGIELNSLSTAKRSDSTIQSGKYSMRFEINRSALTQVRAEVKTGVFPTMNTDVWVTFYLFIPNDFKRDSIYEVFCQFHEYPDFSLGENYRPPPIALHIDKGNFAVNIRSASAPVNTGSEVDSTRTFQIGSIYRGSWMKWQIYAKFSYTNTGITKVWRNDSLVLDKTNYANYYNDIKGPYIKFGIYKPAWGAAGTPVTVVDQRVLFFDNITVGVNQDGIRINKKLFQKWAE